MLYGPGFEAQSLTLTQRDIQLALLEPDFVSQISELKVGTTTHQVMPKAIQRHAFKNIITHVDFLKVTKDAVVTVSVPIHFLEEDQCIGVKLKGGVISHHMSEIEVRAKVGDLPQSIDINMRELDVGSVIHLSELSLPKGVKAMALLQGLDLPVTSVSAFKESKEATAADEGEEGEGEASDS